VFENPVDQRGILDTGDDAQRATARADRHAGKASCTRDGFAPLLLTLRVRRAVAFACAARKPPCRLSRRSGQVSMSIVNTRLRRCAQVIGTGGLAASIGLGRCGTMCLRRLKLGAQTRATASLTYCLRYAQDVRSLSPAL
jgi:hypothetical protein